MIASRFGVAAGVNDVGSTVAVLLTLVSTVASRLGVGTGASLAHAEVVTTTTAASKTISLLNRVAIAGYYTQAATMQHVREKDVSGAITSYLSLKLENPEAGLPTCQDPKPEGYPNALKRLTEMMTHQGGI